MTSNASDAGILERARALVDRFRAHPPRVRDLSLTASELAGTIDHTLLKPEATGATVDALCAEAREFRFASVCVNPCQVARCAQNLRGSGVPVCSVVGFPLGATQTAVKVFEADRALDAGAAEIDMVIQIGALKGEEYDVVKEDIASVAAVCHARRAILKVIIEAALLTDQEKAVACLLIIDASADYAKTSTGFGPGGAAVEDVALMRAAVGPNLGVKAAGGIRNYEAAMAMLRAGATRIGASAGIQIVQGAPAG